VHPVIAEEAVAGQAQLAVMPQALSEETEVLEQHHLFRVHRQLMQVVGQVLHMTQEHREQAVLVAVETLVLRRLELLELQILAVVAAQEVRNQDSPLELQAALAAPA